MLHHHLSQFDGACGPDYSILREVNRVVAWCAAQRIDLVLHGHQHRAALGQGVHDGRFLPIMAGGSAGVRGDERWGGAVPLAYQLIRLDGQGDGLRRPRRFDPFLAHWVDEDRDGGRAFRFGPVERPHRRAARPAVPKPSGSPFHWRGAVDPVWFVGRGAELRTVLSHVAAGQSVSVVSAPRAGRSSFLDAVAQRLTAEQPDRREIRLDLQRVLPDGRAGLLRRLCRALDGDGAQCEHVERLLEEAGRRTVLLLDEFEVLADPAFGPGLPEWIRSLANEGLATFVVATPRPLKETFPKVSGSQLNLFRRVDLGAFCREEAEDLWDRYLAGRDVAFEPAEREEIFTWSDGHPCRLMVLSDHKFRACAGSGVADWVAAAAAEWEEVGR